MNFEEITSYIFSHEDWIFSGIGVLALGAVFTLLKKINYSTTLLSLTKLISLIASLFSRNENVINNLNIDLRPRKNAFEFWLSSPSYVSIWFRTVNFNSFDLIIKQMTVEVVYAGIPLKLNEVFHDLCIPKNSIFEFAYINAPITDSQATHIAQFVDDPSCRISIKATIKTPSREIIYENMNIEYVYYELKNRTSRTIDSQIK